MTQRLFALALETAGWFGLPFGLTLLVAPFLPGHMRSLERVSEVLHIQQAPWILDSPILQATIGLVCIVLPSAGLGAAGWILRRRIERTAAPIDRETIPVWPLRVAGSLFAVVAAFSFSWCLLTIVMLLYFDWIPVLDQEVEAAALVVSAALPLGACAAGIRSGFGLLALANLANSSELADPATDR